jgi:sulfur relay (sulfurtransferase) complex TusBCD TusD component (DsrE family)
MILIFRIQWYRMVSISVIIGQAPYTAERPYTAMRFVNTALLDGHTVKLFLIEDGIFAALKKQNPTEYPNVKQWLEQGLETGSLEVKACGVCLKARGVDEADLVKGVKTASMHELVAWVAGCDKSLFF